MSNKSKRFRALLACFPAVELPIELTSDTHHIFSRENKPISQELIRQFLIEDAKRDFGEFEEYVACFRLPGQEEYVGIVYWKADLMEYKYILKTFDRKGDMIAAQIIAGMKSNGDTLLNRVASFDEEGLIHIAEGIGQADGRFYDADQTRNFQIEILPSGDILQMMDQMD